MKEAYQCQCSCGSMYWKSCCKSVQKVSLFQTREKKQQAPGSKSSLQHICTTSVVMFSMPITSRHLDWSTPSVLWKARRTYPYIRTPRQKYQAPGKLTTAYNQAPGFTCATNLFKNRWVCCVCQKLTQNRMHIVLVDGSIVECCNESEHSGTLTHATNSLANTCSIVKPATTSFSISQSAILQVLSLCFPFTQRLKKFFCFYRIVEFGMFYKHLNGLSARANKRETAWAPSSQSQPVF